MTYNNIFHGFSCCKIYCRLCMRTCPRRLPTRWTYVALRSSGLKCVLLMSRSVCLAWNLHKGIDFLKRRFGTTESKSWNVASMYESGWYLRTLLTFGMHSRDGLRVCSLKSAARANSFKMECFLFRTVRGCRVSCWIYLKCFSRRYFPRCICGLGLSMAAEESLCCRKIYNSYSGKQR